MGVSQPTLVKLEKADANPRKSTLKKIAAAMGGQTGTTGCVDEILPQRQQLRQQKFYYLQFKEYLPITLNNTLTISISDFTSRLDKIEIT